VHSSASRIEEARSAAGLTKVEVAKHLGISAQAYGRYELGQRKPNIKILMTLSKLFKVHIDYFLYDNQEIDENTDFTEMSIVECAKQYEILLNSAIHRCRISRNATKNYHRQTKTGWTSSGEEQKIVVLNDHCKKSKNKVKQIKKIILSRFEEDLKRMNR
jgi:transcriptional regulator with XRE-family HTH domain